MAKTITSAIVIGSLMWIFTMAFLNNGNEQVIEDSENIESKYTEFDALEIRSLDSTQDDDNRFCSNTDVMRSRSGHTDVMRSSKGRISFNKGDVGDFTPYHFGRTYVDGPLHDVMKLDRKKAILAQK